MRSLHPLEAGTTARLHNGRMPAARSPARMMAILLFVAGCGTDPAGAPRACEGLADRWVMLQQQILDSVDHPAPESDAGNRHALAMIEQARDASGVGCSEEVAAGAPLICARLPVLQPRGPQGEALIADLMASCP